MLSWAGRSSAAYVGVWWTMSTVWSLEHFLIRRLQLESLPPCSISSLNYRLLLKVTSLIQLLLSFPAKTP